MIDLKNCLKDKRLQKMAVAAVLLAALLLFIMMNVSSAKKTRPATNPRPAGNFRVVDDRKTYQEGFEANYGKALNDMQKTVGRLEADLQNKEKELAAMKDRSQADLKKLQESQAKTAEAQKKNQAELERLRQQQKNDADKLSKEQQAEIAKQIKELETATAATETDSSGTFLIPPPVGTPQTEITKRPTPPDPNNFNGGQVAPEVPTASIVMSGLIRGGASPKTAASTTVSAVQKPKPRTVIPTGSIIKGILLSGFIAPTMGSGMAEPVPALIRVVDEAILPNFYRADLKECFIIADVKGDLSSETAKVRMNRLACIKLDGTPFEKTIKGYATGENGMEGLQGRVVSKQATMLGRALLAGFVQGVAEAFQYDGSSYSISTDGVLQTVDTSKIAQTSLFSGMGLATQKLADFYIGLVEQMVPVIEINAGRTIEMILTAEIDLTDTQTN